MKFKMEIELGNDELLNYEQLEHVIMAVAARIHRMQPSLDEEHDRGIMDANGNTVGSWHIVND